MEVVTKAGIPWVVSRVWMDGDQALERRLKNQHGSPPLCPICTGKVGPGYAVDIKRVTFQRAAPALGQHIGKRKPMH